MNIVKTTKASKAYSGIIASLSGNDIINGYFGGSNLLAEYLNDYSSSNLNFFIAEWINENKADMDQYDINSILETPDWIIQQAVRDFYYWLESIFPTRGEYVLKSAFYSNREYWDKWFVFALPWAGACSNYYIVNAENESEAYQTVITDFEKHFLIEDESDIDENTEHNDNGRPVNTDNLFLCGILDCKE